MSTRRNDGVYPSDSNTTIQLTKRELFAVEAMKIPRNQEEINIIVNRSRNKNPHNESHKPPVLSEREARMLLAVMDADALVDMLNMDIRNLP